MFFTDRSVPRHRGNMRELVWRESASITAELWLIRGHFEMKRIGMCSFSSSDEIFGV